MVNAVVLQPLPFAEAERLVWVWGQFSLGNQASVSPPDFLDYRAQNRVFEELAAMRFSSFNLTGAAEPERLTGANITANFFRTLSFTASLANSTVAWSRGSAAQVPTTSLPWSAKKISPPGSMIFCRGCSK